jgi:hypothetical protein
MAFPGTFALAMPAVIGGGANFGTIDIDGVVYSTNQIYTREGYESPNPTYTSQLSPVLGQGHNNADNIITVTEKPVQVKVQLWGGAGGNGNSLNSGENQGGGAGEYRHATFLLQPGQYTLMLGNGGTVSYYSNSYGGGGYGGGGGAAGYNGSAYVNGTHGTAFGNGGQNTSFAASTLGWAGGGGGMTGLFDTLTKSQATSLLIAAGGAGGSSWYNNSSSGHTTKRAPGGGDNDASLYGGNGAGRGQGGWGGIVQGVGSTMTGGGGGGYIGGKRQTNNYSLGGQGYTHGDATDTFQENGERGKGSASHGAAAFAEPGGTDQPNYIDGRGDGASTSTTPDTGNGGLAAITILAARRS